jgi:peptidoglycan hydrolase-like protein with peptidoglycan-binding domain
VRIAPLAGVAFALAACTTVTPLPQRAVAPDTTLFSTVRSNDLRDAQLELARTGDYVGPIDGRSNPDTVAALEKFQQAHGLPETGWLDQATSDALGVNGMPEAGYGSSVPPPR